MSVVVTNIANDVSESQLSSFFSFCGKIDSIDLTKDGDLQQAKIVFAQQEAAKTALLLSGTQLSSLKLDVNPLDHKSPEPSLSTNEAPASYSDISQEDKPKSAIMAELLSHGFVLTDVAIEKSAEFDQTHGISSRFTNFVSSLDSKYGISTSAHSADDKYSISANAAAVESTVLKYLDKALGTAPGVKVRKFYNDAFKTVADIRAEARRLADIREGKPFQTDQTDQTEGEHVIPESASVSL
ncbi:hypothetical protein V1512DRAFT_265443 [Lipomyces arxii]|uniref:uncharacterized protein n=1 Tax=Lipomyces arxii TaxID=56418 RepID=UPI0034CD4497